MVNSLPMSGMIQGQLLTNDISDPRILQAMATVRREDFLPEHLKSSAYVDEDLAVGGGRYLMEPLVFARLLDMAAITPACRVLLVGALSGYAAAVACQLGGHITATEIDAERINEAKDRLGRLYIENVDLQKVKSLAEGYAPSSPYEVVVVCGAIDFVPEDLGAQLALGGRLVAVHRKAARPGVPMGLGKAMLVKRISNQLQYREMFDASTALLPGFAREEGFRF